MRRTPLGLALGALAVLGLIVAASLDSLSRAAVAVDATLRRAEANVIEAAPGSFVLRGRDTVAVVTRIAGARGGLDRPDSLMMYLGRLTPGGAGLSATADSLALIMRPTLNWNDPLRFELLRARDLGATAHHGGWMYLQPPDLDLASPGLRLRVYTQY